VQFTSAEDARRAIPTLASSVLFLLDVHLSGNESGIDLLRWLREQPPPLGDTPAIMLTGSDHPRTALKHSSRRHGFLRKARHGGDANRLGAIAGFQIVTSLVSGRMMVRIERR